MQPSRIGRSVAARFIAGWALLAGASALAATINVPGDQPTIAGAIDAAAPGDVIHVEVGTYNERLEVPKGLDNLTLEGEPASGTVIEATPGTSDNILRVRSNGVLIQDFTLRGGNTAVRLDYSTGSTVRFMTIEGPREGIRVTNGAFDEITECVISDTTGGAGVKVSNSPHVSVGVWVINARRDGIRVQNSPGALIHGNAVEGTRGGDGIRLSRIVDGTADLNFVQNNAKNGMRIQSSPGIVVENNEADFNGEYGIRVEHSPPIASVTDLENAGNAGTDNGSGNFRVIP